MEDDEVEDLRPALADVPKTAEASGLYASMQKRVDYLERSLGGMAVRMEKTLADAADKQARELKAARDIVRSDTALAV